MNGLIEFLKETFLNNQTTSMKIGLSQFKSAPQPEIQAKKPSIDTKNVKLSDLMRRAS